jgi:hypothetical protein
MLRKSKAQSTLEYIVVLTVTGVGQLLIRSQPKIESSSQDIVDMTK